MLKISGIEFTIIEINESIDTEGRVWYNKWGLTRYDEKYIVKNYVRRWDITCTYKHAPRYSNILNQLRTFAKSGIQVKIEIDEGPLHQFTGSGTIISLSSNLKREINLNIRETRPSW
jgi:hypothetical protein